MFDDLLGFVAGKHDITSGDAWFGIRDFLPEPVKPAIRYGAGYDRWRGQYQQWYKRKVLLEEALRALELFNVVEKSRAGHKAVPQYRFLPGQYHELTTRLSKRAERRQAAELSQSAV